MPPATMMSASPEADHRGREVDALEAGAADDVQRLRGDLDGKAGLEGGLARDVLALRGLEHAAHKDFVNLLGFHARAVEGFLDHDSTELRGGDTREGTAHFADCGAAGTGQYDFL